MNDTELKGGLEPARGWYCVKCGVYNDLQSQSCVECEGPNRFLVAEARQQSHSAVVEKQKSRAVFMILGFLFGYLGIHNVYVGRKAEAYFQLFLGLFLSWTVVVPLIMYFWSLVEIFTVREDGRGNPMR